jgi:hypothetical protein
MRASVAAAYLDECSVEAFRRAIGTLYPEPVRISGKGERWLKEDLDAAIERLAGKTTVAFDAAAVLPTVPPGES